MRVLIVEDDPLLGDGIRAGLEQAGFVAIWVENGESALTVLAAESFAAVVLDLGLPGKDGLSVLTEMRNREDHTPVLILTARDTVADRVAGLDRGADDYLVKPFDLDELTARLRALMRRASQRGTPQLRYGALVLDPVARQVTLEGQTVDLPPREYALLEALLTNMGKALTRRQLEAQIYGWGEEVESNALDVHIHHLRRKFGSGLIRTLRGVGYMIPREESAPAA